jgi:hypothetical protein
MALAQFPMDTDCRRQMADEEDGWMDGWMDEGLALLVWLLLQKQPRGKGSEICNCRSRGREGGREGTADGKQQLQPRWKEGGEEAIYVLRVSTTESFFFLLCVLPNTTTRDKQKRTHA